LAYETDLTATVDPFAGSYAVEAMTDEVEAAAVELIEQVDELGGAVHAIEQGFQKSEIERTAYDTAKEIDSGERVVVGLNRYRLDVEDPYQPLRVDPTIEDTARERLATLRSSRSASDVERALDDLRKAAEGSNNVLYPMKQALAASATVGEVCHALRDVWGTYVPVEFF
ncbi:MAG: methylmalonyl-CoA mutase family protein, partial [Pseudonocardiaceae bacterium]